MSKLAASRIKKVMFGVLLSDGSLSAASHRFDFYSNKLPYAEYILDVASNLTHTRFSLKDVRNKKYGDKVVGYRVWSTKSKYLTKLRSIFYPANGRKRITKYIVDRLDAESLAHIWMCDGYLERAKNRKTNRVQNVGWICYDCFPFEELQILSSMLETRYGISSSILKSTSAGGFGYRIRLGGENLQRFISIIYPYMLNCFKYKTYLFYRRKETALMMLPSAEHFIVEYSGVDDIVRYLSKDKQT